MTLELKMRRALKARLADCPLWACRVFCVPARKRARV